ncbi:MAG: hypothetical protein WBP81_07895 [Solirubrobacteraceae bacterium]
MRLERSAWTGHLALCEVTVASFPMCPAVGPTGHLNPPLDVHGRFPPGAVAFRLLLQDGWPGHMSAALEHPESRFPIALDTFVASEDRDKQAPPSIWRSVDANGQQYRAIAWLAADARQALRSQLGEVVGSLSFPRLRPGSVVGVGFTVLENEDRYPVGSFTPVRAGGMPLLLVHAPGGFYALGWKWSGSPESYRSTCEHCLDESRKEIFCKSCEARWDRIGRVITRPATAGHDEPLHLSIAKVAWDGHVLVHSGTFQIGSAPNARRFWPQWGDGH